MASYHFVYFDVRGIVEPIRILFALTGTPYTEERVEFFKEWPIMKASGRCPFGQLPLLELGDGTTLCQSPTILRFLAKELGFLPSSNIEQARADILVDAVRDLQSKHGHIFYEQDPERKAKMTASMRNEVLPKQMEYFDKILQQHNGGNGYFVGDKISYGDLSVFCFINGYIAGGALEVPEMVKKHPLLADHYKRIMNEPKILEYIKNRKPNPDWYPY